MNNGAGALKIVFSATRPAWGTNAQPTTSQPYDFYLDMGNTGVYNYAYHYAPTQQAVCGHATSIWISDHPSPPAAGSGLISGYPATTPYSNYAICWTVGSTGWYTNLHAWSGLSTASEGVIAWGTSGTSAVSMYLRN